jgi:hypothetical protein
MEDNITFDIIEPTGKGKKKVAADEKENLKGSPREAFSKERWAHDTDRLLKATKHIPEDAWDEIIAAAQRLVKDSVRKLRGCSDENDSSGEECGEDDDDDNEDEYTDLYSYR